MAWMLAISLRHLQASVGYYYQHREQEHVDGSGVRGRLAYDINNGLVLAANLSYDKAFDTRFSADLAWRFNANGGPSKETTKTNNVVSALASMPSDRDVRVHDDFLFYMFSAVMNFVTGQVACSSSQATSC